jgi:hypothetical protein
MGKGGEIAFSVPYYQFGRTTRRMCVMDVFGKSTERTKGLLSLLLKCNYQSLFDGDVTVAVKLHDRLAGLVALGNSSS